MVFCCLPRAIEQLHLTEILYCEATPVIRSTVGLETTFAAASVLVAQHLEPSIFVPSQQVWTEQPSASPVQCGDRSPVNDRRAYLGVSGFQCADGNRHRSQHIALLEALDSQMPQHRRGLDARLVRFSG
jgi:hypothetical protein